MLLLIKVLLRKRFIVCNWKGAERRDPKAPALRVDVEVKLTNTLFLEYCGPP